MTEHRTPIVPTVVPVTPSPDTRLLKKVRTIRPALALRETPADRPEAMRRAAA